MREKKNYKEEKREKRIIRQRKNEREGECEGGRPRERRRMRERKNEREKE